MKKQKRYPKWLLWIFIIFAILVELALFVFLLVVLYWAIADQSMFEFAVFVVGALIWKYLGLFVSWRPSEIKMFLDDYQEGREAKQGE